MLGWLKRAFTGGTLEQRASASGFTAEVVSMRQSYISGARGLAELCATSQSCISLWEHGLSMADTSGTDLLTRRVLAMMARSLALRGEALFLISDDGLIPASDWDLSTRNSKPRAYRLSISEAGGGRSMTALSAEVLHVVIGADGVTPWLGQAPLRRASLTASMLHAIESALAETYTESPLGSQVVPMPEQPDVDNEALGQSFRGKRGRVLLRESTVVSAAGGPSPQADWRPQSLSPDLERAMTTESLSAARDAICGVFGVLPSLFDKASAGPAIREGQRHLAQWQLQPIAGLLAEEASQKLGSNVTIDTMRPLQAFDAGGRARALSTIVQALAAAKEAGVDPAPALALVDWKD